MFLPPSPLILLYNDGGRGKEDKNVFPSSSLHPQTLPEIRRERKRKTRKNRGRFFSPSAACRAFFNGKNLEKGPSLPYFSAKFFRSTFSPRLFFSPPLPFLRRKTLTTTAAAAPSLLAAPPPSLAARRLTGERKCLGLCRNSAAALACI